MDGGSTDNSVEIIRKWQDKLAGWRSEPDEGQAAAINEGITLGNAPYVCWLNSDDFFYAKALTTLLSVLEGSPEKAMVYGKCWTVSRSGTKLSPYVTINFSKRLFANFCFIAQPATLIRREAWEKVGGLDENLFMAFDYELWWKLLVSLGPPAYCKQFVAASRVHSDTKTSNFTDRHYQESVQIVSNYYHHVPIKWKIGLPIMKLFRRLAAQSRV